MLCLEGRVGLRKVENSIGFSGVRKTSARPRTAQHTVSCVRRLETDCFHKLVLKFDFLFAVSEADRLVALLEAKANEMMASLQHRIEQTFATQQSSFEASFEAQNRLLLDHLPVIVRQEIQELYSALPTIIRNELNSLIQNENAAGARNEEVADEQQPIQPQNEDLEQVENEASMEDNYFLHNLYDSDNEE